MQGMFEIFVKYNEVMQKENCELCLKHSVYCIDPSPAFDMPYRERFSLFVDRMHFTEAGNEKLAKAVFNDIKGHL